MILYIICKKYQSLKALNIKQPKRQQISFNQFDKQQKSNNFIKKQYNLSFNLLIQNKLVQNQQNKMRQNNNQQQKCGQKSPLQIITIHDNSLSRKVLELQVQMQKTQKHYQSIKKPIKFFTKYKRSFVQHKNQIPNNQNGILSEKIIPPNINDNIGLNQKGSILHNTKLKNVFEAYKQTLEEKYKKRMKQMEKSSFKINTTKINQTEINSQQIIKGKQEQIRKRFSHKKVDININSANQTPKNKQSIKTPSNAANKTITSNITADTFSNRESLQKSYRLKQASSHLLNTIDEQGHNFIKTTNKKSINNNYSTYNTSNHNHSTQNHSSQSINNNPNKILPSHNQQNIYQHKKKCYTQNTKNQEEKYQEELNKTRNISFKLPHQKRKSIKHFIQRIGGMTYNLPHINDKLHTNDTISYLVKSLRKPPLSQNCKPQRSYQIDRIQQSVQKINKKIKQKRTYTLQLQHQHSISTQYNQNIQQNIEQNQQNNEQIEQQQQNRQKKKNRRRYRIKNKNRKQNKYNIIGNIQGWKTQNNQNIQGGNTQTLFKSCFHDFNSIL